MFDVQPNVEGEPFAFWPIVNRPGIYCRILVSAVDGELVLKLGFDS
jgi:hypothetical protein